MTRQQAFTQIIRHLLGIVKVIAVYGEVQHEFPKLFPVKAVDEERIHKFNKDALPQSVQAPSFGLMHKG